MRPDVGWPRDEHIGRIVNDKYRVTKRLGEGGFGVVLCARHVRGEVDLGPVVVKFLHPHLARRADARRRFLNEARAARTLRSPHVVKVFDFDFDRVNGTPFIVMEYLEGTTLRRKMKRSLSPVRLFPIALQICSALKECHAAGILHRDLTPKNVLLLPEGDFVKLIDFGIAQFPEGTMSDSMLGTPKYMPPEQIRRQLLDDGVDIFALGVTLFECLAGEPPILAEESADYLRLNLATPARRLRSLAPRLPEELDKLLDSMMAKDKAARISSMADVEARLRAIGVKHGWLSERPAMLSSELAARPADDQTESLLPDSEASTTLPPTAAWEKTTSPGSRRLRRWGWGLVALAAVAAAGFAIREAVLRERPAIAKHPSGVAVDAAMNLKLQDGREAVSSKPPDQGVARDLGNKRRARAATRPRPRRKTRPPKRSPARPPARPPAPPIRPPSADGRYEKIPGGL